MRMKGISCWEQHLERIVLAAAILLFLAFASQQFIGEPNAVETAGTHFAPGDVDRALEEEATSIQGQFGNEFEPHTRLGPLDIRHDAIQASLNEPILPRDRISPFTTSIMPLISDSAIVGGLVHAPLIPAVGDLGWTQYLESVDDEFVGGQPEVRALLGEAPYDVQFITVGGSFPIGAVRELFSARGPNGEAPIPPHWHGDRVHIVDVRLERQELIDGAWLNPVLIDRIPTQFSYREEIESGANRSLADSIEAQLSNEPEAQLALIQPEFWPLENGDWQPPAFRDIFGANSIEEDPRVREIEFKQRRLEKERQRAAALLALLESKGGPLDDDDGRSGSGSANTGDDDDFGDTSDERGLTPPTGRDDEQSLRERRRLTMAWRQMLLRIEQLERELEALGAGADSPTNDAITDPAEALRRDVIDVWAHDPTVEPGRTYRYRLRVDVLNPLFGREMFLQSEQHDAAAQFTLNSEWTDWSPPVHVPRPIEFFVTAAYSGPADRAGGEPAARFEVFRFHDGRWWKKTFSARAGERIGGVRQVRQANAKPGDPKVEIDFTTNWFVLDVVTAVRNDDRNSTPGMGAAVRLQSLTIPEDVIVRSVAHDLANPHRRELDRHVKADRESGAPR